MGNLLLDCEGLVRSLESRSPRWDNLQRQHLKAQPCCMICGTKRRRQVHHVKPFHLYPDDELNPANLLTLCAPHHLLIGHLMYWRSWNPAVVQMAAVLREAIRLRP